MTQLERLSDVCGHAPRSLVRGYDAVGAMASSPSNLLSSIHRPDLRPGLGLVVGAVAGYIYGKKMRHEYLGAIAGATLGSAVPGLLNPAERSSALGTAIQVAGAVAGVKLVKKHPLIGFLGGGVAGGFLANYAGMR